jgi:DNA integrity scanning protein DisA with diadenylate cyclase activity
MFRRICSEVRKCNLEVLETVIEIAVGIARQHGERSSIGALFVVGDEEEVLKRTKPLILDPLERYPKELKDIRDANVQGTLKELSKLDGAFVISGDGYALSAARYIQVTAHDIDLPLGFGSRHMAAASISKETDAVVVMVSEDDGVVRIFDDGELVGEIISGIWNLEMIKPRIQGEYEKIVERNLNFTMIVKRT